MRNRYGLIVTLAVTLLSQSVHGADRALGSFRDWSAMAFGNNKELTCMAFTQPVKSEGKYSKRGEAFVFVTHRPADAKRQQVSIETGYSYKGDAPATITIDGVTFALRTEGSTAWLKQESRNSELVNAMKAGRTMLVKGTSSRGNDTLDQYSLLGFSAAVRAIDRACKPR